MTLGNIKMLTVRSVGKLIDINSDIGITVSHISLTSIFDDAFQPLLNLKLSLFSHKMENKQFYIKYLTNQPVGLKTHILINTTGLWVQTLFTVGDLIAAFQQLPNSPLAHAFVGDLTLHYINNGVETNYNSWDSLTVLGENGRLGTTPLIIRSANGICDILTISYNPNNR
jgi:hypothetical protein